MAFPGGAHIGVVRQQSAAPLPVMQLDFLNNATLPDRITFSRGTNATLIDSTGKLTYAPNNLLTFTEQFGNVIWTQANITRVDGVTDPNGGSNACRITATATNATFQQIGPTVAANAISSFWIRRVSGTGTINLIAPNGGFSTALSVTSDWQRFSALELNRAGVVFAGVRITTIGDAVEIAFPQAEIVTYQTTPSTYVATTASAYYGPRFDYDPVTLAPRGLLIEEARTNLVQQSEAFGTSPWSAYGVSTVTANATASPAGTITADLLTANGSNGQQQTIPSVLANTAYAFSIYVKLGSVGTQIAVELSCYAGGTGGTFLGYVFSSAGRNITSGTPVGNGWFRLTISGTTIATTDTLVLRLLTVNTGDNFYIWGTQLELGAFATSYIPTVASTVTRNADVATMTGTNFSSWYNQSEGTFVIDSAYSPVSGTSYGLACAFQGASNFININNNGNRALYVFVGGVNQVDLSPGGYVAYAPAKIASAYKVDDFATTINARTVLTDTSGTLPVPTSFRIGRDAQELYINNHIRTIAYFNTRLPNAQLQTLTAPSLATTLSLDFTSGSYNVGF